MPETDARTAQLVELARLATARGDRAAAIASYGEAVAIHEAGGEGADVETLVALGTLEAEAGQLDAAAGHLRTALDRQAAQLGEDSPDLADTMMRLAAVSASLDDLGSAEGLLRRAIGVVEPESAALPALLNELARVLVRRGDNGGAESVLVRLHATKVAQLGAVHPEVATVGAALAAVRQALGKHESAEQLWREVLEVRERVLAPGHFATSIAIEGLAGACATRGRFAEAVGLLRRAVVMREQTLGAGHASLSQLRARIADLELQAAYADPATAGSSGPGTSLAMLPLPALPSRNGADRASVQLATRGGAGPATSNGAPPVTRIVASRVAGDEPGSASREDAVAEALRSLRQEIRAEESAEPRRNGATPLLIVPEDDEMSDDWQDLQPGFGALFARRRVPIVAGALILLGAIAAVSLAARRGGAEDDEWAVASETAAPSLSLAGAAGAGAPVPGALEAAAGGAIAPAADSSRERGERAPRTEPRTRTAPEPRADASSEPAVRAPAAPAVDLSGVTSEIGRRSGAIDSVAGGRPGVLESARASLTGAAPIRTGVRSADVGFRAALLDTKGPQPLYPTALQGTRRRGTATLEFTVDSSGRQYGVARVARADHPAFAQSVLDALPRMRFVPATENGTPVSQRVVMTFTFVPQDE